MLQYRIALTFTMLLYASYTDFKTREVPDKVWIIFSGLGVLLSIWEAIFTPDFFDLWIALISLGVASLIAIPLYCIDFYGGADAKALISLAIILPTYTPRVYLPIYDLFNIPPISAVTVFTNSLISTLLLPLYFSTLNTFKLARGERIFEGFESEALSRKLAALFLGYRLKDDEQKRFYFPLEKVEGGRRRLDLKLPLAEDEFTAEAGIWATPGIPLIIYMTVGFIFMLLVGDGLAIIISLAAGVSVKI